MLQPATFPSPPRSPPSPSSSHLCPLPRRPSDPKPELDLKKINREDSLPSARSPTKPIPPGRPHRLHQVKRMRPRQNKIQSPVEPQAMTLVYHAACTDTISFILGPRKKELPKNAREQVYLPRSSQHNKIRPDPPLKLPPPLQARRISRPIRVGIPPLTHWPYGLVKLLKPSIAVTPRYAPTRKWNARARMSGKRRVLETP